MQAGTLVSRGSLQSAAPRLIPREAELRDIRQLLLEDDVRLVTLVGPPGAGKTRLGSMAAVDLGRLFGDGVVFVDLSPVQDPALVPAAIGAALGIWEAGDRDVTAGLEIVLRDRRLLLFLDNFEHLLPAGHFVARLLNECVRLKVLVTSREALRLGIEHRFAVAPLRVPSELDESSPRQLERVPSVALFCLRARAVRSDWALDDTSLHAVAELCRRLDGLPLAIELAADWIGVLSARAVLTRLNVCLNAESVAAADQPDRHRSLRAAIAWSYDLLSEPEREVFDRLAVFSGGWDEEAAAAVVGTTPDAVLPMLAALAGKHLVRSAEQSDGEPRFGLLDTLHAFARARLDARPDAEVVRRQHAEYFASLAEVAERALVGPDQRLWLDRLERELGNLRTALSWAIEKRDASLALRLASALWFFWDMRGHLMEGQQWLVAAMAMPGGGLGQLRAAALNAAGWLALVQHGAYARGIALLQEARSAAVTAGDERALVRADAFLGLALALGTREHAQSEELLQAAVAEGRANGDAWAVALALYGLGHMAAVQGQWTLVNERWQTAAAVAQGVGNLYGQSYLQFRWGVLAFADLDLPRAAACLRTSLQMASELDSTREMAVAMAALVLVAWAGGQARRAARLAGVTQAFLERAGCYLPAFLSADYERTIESVRERLGNAAFARSFGAGHGLTPHAGVAEALETGELPRYLPLTAREWEVSRLVARGLSNKEVSDHLGLSERTIGTHLERIFGKLHIKSRTELAVWAAEREVPDGRSERPSTSATDEVRIGPARRSSRALRLVGT